MNKTSENLINKFISGQRLSDEEFILFNDFLNDLHYRDELIRFLEKNWQQSQPEEVALQFEQIREKIRVSSLKVKMNRLFIALSKAAAILFIPLIAAVLYFYFNQPISSEMLTLSTEKGEFTHVILPDGSRVWLNVDTKLSYPADYGLGSRKLELEGEAYFEVKKDEELPFEVTSGNLTTTALGTRFVISAYPESSVIKSSLLEGSVEIKYGNTYKIIEPGQQLTLDKNKQALVLKAFSEEYELSWKNNQLVFRLTPFDHVISILEKWYDISIVYNPELFKSETLTVRFEKYESLENVLKVISKVNGFNYKVEGNNVKITK
ncbi:FecR family protein [Mariniphaga sediminis]|uniref:FecR family protein n=1 Tax=Mariniphaga sediminis TaxID=1628158 RepID=A0A399CVL3_9BACT|nr:FecR family protein [Mariniphaga sediminis]RIH63048.1 FecR family protein [Mariniphaga sediminis]